MSVNIALIRVDAKTLARAKEDAELCEELCNPEEENDRTLELGTSWQQLEPELTSKEPLLAEAFHGDKVLNEDIDLGFGPPSFLGAAKVAKIAKLLAAPPRGALSKELLAALKAPLADPKRKSWKSATEERQTHLRLAFEDLRAFYAKAAAAKESVISACA